MGHTRNKNGFEGAATYDEWMSLAKGVDCITTEEKEGIPIIVMHKGSINNYVPTSKIDKNNGTQR